MTTSTPTPLIDLTPYLEGIGLRINRVAGAEIQAWCPAHAERTGSEDRKPSFYFNQAKLVGHCYSCDWRVPSLEVLASYLTGGPVDQDIVTEAKAVSLASGVSALGKAKRDAIDDRRILEWQYNQFPPMPAALLAFRKLSADMAALFGVRYDKVNRCWILPIRTPRGKLLGWQQRQKGAVFNYPKGMVKSETLFGMHLVEGDRLVLVESPLDAVRLRQCGIEAVASFGAEVSNKQIEILARNCTEVIVALDNPAIDPAGAKATDRVLFQLRKRVGAVPWRYEGRVKDPGDYSTDQEIIDAWKRTRLYGL
jgi:DNA primase